MKLDNSTSFRMRDNDESTRIAAPVMALDFGAKRVGVAVSDKLLITITRLDALSFTNWKRFVHDLTSLVERFDAQTMVIGLPLRLDGTLGSAALDVERRAGNLALSLKLPVFLQDERLTSREAAELLRAEGHNRETINELIDSEAAAIILRDFITTKQPRLHVVQEEKEVKRDKN